MPLARGHTGKRYGSPLERNQMSHIDRGRTLIGPALLDLSDPYILALMSAAGPRGNYFVFTHFVLLLIVLLAFTPTFFLRSVISQPPVLDMPSLPLPFVVHGIILIGWYVLLAVQPALVRTGNMALHRRLGGFGVALAVAVLVSTGMMVLRFPLRMQALSAERGIPVDELEPGLNMILWLDLFMILLFVGFVTAGIAKRNRAQAHKRYMLFAGISLVFAAVGRLGGIVSQLLELPMGMFLGLGLLLGLTSSLLLHDRSTYKHIHRSSWICFAVYWVGTILSMVLASMDEKEQLTALLLAW
jgi:hypothetical protein